MREVLCIGDLHGHLDRLEALLRQEGLLDRCPDCDGSGMFPVTDRIEDDCAACEGDGWRRTDKDVEVVLVGDIGHFGRDGSPTGDLMTWRAAVLWADVILWGNHDRALVSRAGVFNGYLRPTGEVYHLIARARREGKLKLAHAAHGYLVTHAGLAEAFRHQNVSDEIKADPSVFANWVNHSDEVDGSPDILHLPYRKEFLAVRDAISIKRGGRSNAGGILWRDISEKLYARFPQVFGHSADHAEHQVRYVGPNFHTRKLKDYETWALANKVKSPPSYCVDIGGKGDRPGDDCLAGVYLPSGKVVTWRSA